MADSNSPEANFRLGNVTATVWSNESSSANGNKKFRTVYKDGDEWKSLGTTRTPGDSPFWQIKKPAGESTGRASRRIAGDDRELPSKSTTPKPGRARLDACEQSVLAIEVGRIDRWRSRPSFR